MKKLILLFFVFLILDGSLTVALAERVLKGEVLLVGPSGEEDTEPANLVTVSLPKEEKSTETDDLGQFTISLPLSLTFGKTVILRVQQKINGKSWKMWNPINGEIPLPRSLFITIKLLPKGSKKFWTDEFIEYHIAKMAEDAKREATAAQPTETKKQVDLGPLMKKWAMDYGFTAQDVKDQIDQWVVGVEAKQEDFYKLGLAAYAKKHFERAAELFEEDGAISAKQFQMHEQKAQVHEQKSKVFREKAVRGYRKAGDSYSSDYEFTKALTAYNQSLTYVEKNTSPELWAEVQIDIAGANWPIGTQAEGQAVYKHLEAAHMAYRKAEEAYAGLLQVEGQAAAQVGIGIVLTEQGRRAEGVKGQQLLAEAVTAYRAALEVYTRAQLPQDWAQTHNNLADAALALEDWEQVITSYRNVLALYPDDQDAYLTTNAVLHEKLFRYEEAFALNQQWLEGHPDDELATMNFAEVHLTAGRLAEAEHRFAGFLAGSELDAQDAIPLHLLQVVSLVGQSKMDGVAEHLQDIHAALGQQPEDFTLGWSFEGTTHFIGQHEAFGSSRAWLVALLEGFSGKTRDDMLAAVERAQATIVAGGS